MNGIRHAFVEASEVALALLRSPEVGKRWTGPSALERMTVGALCGHLARATSSVEIYLDRPEPETEPSSAAEYYDAALSETGQVGSAPNLDSPLHAAIRQRAEDEAAGGSEEVVSRLEAALERLRARLGSEAEDRRVEVFKGICLLLDDYLITRMIELAVHADDLAVSLGVPMPDTPPLVMDLAIQTLVEVGRLRHGDAAILRSLTRRERDELQALRVL